EADGHRHIRHRRRILVRAADTRRFVAEDFELADGASLEMHLAGDDFGIHLRVGAHALRRKLGLVDDALAHFARQIHSIYGFIHFTSSSKGLLTYAPSAQARCSFTPAYEIKACPVGFELLAPESHALAV